MGLQDVGIMHANATRPTSRRAAQCDEPLVETSLRTWYIFSISFSFIFHSSPFSFIHSRTIGLSLDLTS